jgi:hypothetical protein
MTFNQTPMDESSAWLELLNDESSEVKIEKENHEITETCARAKKLLEEIDRSNLSLENILEILQETHNLDQTAVSWRKGPNWTFKTVHRSELSVSQNSPTIQNLPEVIQLHKDPWIAYEWNYHRTARLLMHEHLLRCIDRLLCKGSLEDYAQNQLGSLQWKSRAIVQGLAAEILSTVPQSFGDIDHNGNLRDQNRPVRSQGVGAYFLLWPMKIIKRSNTVTKEQKNNAQLVFERIRERTGMKSTLGDLSCI